MASPFQLNDAGTILAIESDWLDKGHVQQWPARAQGAAPLWADQDKLRHHQQLGAMLDAAKGRPTPTLQAGVQYHCAIASDGCGSPLGLGGICPGPATGNGCRFRGKIRGTAYPQAYGTLQQWAMHSAQYNRPHPEFQRHY